MTEQEEKDSGGEASGSPRPALDSEMYAVALCVEGLEAVKDDPRSLNRVINFIASRYLDGLIKKRDEIDADIKALQDKIARDKYTDRTLVEVVNNDETVEFRGVWGSESVRVAWEAGCRVRKVQLGASERDAEIMAAR